MKIDSVIFDCDGVLVDSEALASEVWRDFLLAHNLERSIEEINRDYAGKTDAAIRDIIFEETGISLPENTADQIEDLALKRFEMDLEPIAYVKDVLKTLTHPKCVCSNSRSKRLLSSLTATMLRDYFPKGWLFSSDQVDKPKPAPDLHLYAASQTGFKPENTVVIEDSATGVQAALKAGMRAFGFIGAAHIGPEHAEKLITAGAELIFSDMRELPSLLDQS